MGLQAAEQLVTELAAGRVGTDFKPTEIQSELNIPTFLVYLFGIVIAEDEYHRWKNEKPALKDPETLNSFSSIREKRFCVFQKQYFESLEKVSPVATKPYKLTTRMIPSKEQQAVVKRDLLVECEKLESISNEALEALLLEEATLSQQALANSKRKKKKKKNKQQSVANSENNAVEVETSNKEITITTQEVAATIDAKSTNEKSSKNETTNHCGDSEMEKPDAVNTTRSNLSKGQVESDDPMKDEGFQLIKNMCRNSSASNMADNNYDKKVSTRDSGRSGVEKVESLLNTLTSSPPPIQMSLNASIVPSDLEHSTDDTSVLAQRIRHLEHELAEANRRSEEERMAHSKALRKEKDRHESLIQALQLRLYISENKVRTYEDALEQHIKSVSIINGSGRSVKKRHEEDRVPNSPLLISKVLESTRAARNGEI